MTESKIFVAKQGLKLLKKKMNRTGISRQKTYSQVNQIESVKPEPNFKKITAKPQTADNPRKAAIITKSTAQ